MKANIVILKGGIGAIIIWFLNKKLGINKWNKDYQFL
jgi:hypothetical protein